MKNRRLSSLELRSILVLMTLATTIIGFGGMPRALAADDPPLPGHFSGLLHDYTPATAGGPYVMDGTWSLNLNEGLGAAAFSAEIAMETADFANPDPNHDPTKLNAHTHHLSMADGVIHDDLTDPINWMTACPKFKGVAGGFVVTGTAYVTGNGGNAPFGNPSSVTICILGGMHDLSITGPQAFVVFSNFTLTFGTGSPASTHFGTQAINGVVVHCERRSPQHSNDCKVAVAE